MNGVPTKGGMDGFGKVEPEPNEPMFHTEWEARVLAMVRAMGAAGAFNIDTSRFYREMLPPHVYLSSSYYKKWFLGLEDLLVDKGYIGADEVAAGHAMQPPKPLKHGKFALVDVERVMARGRFGRPAPAAAKFKSGDRVRARNIHRQLTPGCRGTCAAMSAWSSAITAATCIRIRSRSRPAKIRNGFTRSSSRAPSFGARTPIRL